MEEVAAGQVVRHCIAKARDHRYMKVEARLSGVAATPETSIRMPGLPVPMDAGSRLYAGQCNEGHCSKSTSRSMGWASQRVLGEHSCVALTCAHDAVHCKRTARGMRRTVLLYHRIRLSHTAKLQHTGALHACTGQAESEGRATEPWDQDAVRLLVSVVAQRRCC